MIATIKGIIIEISRNHIILENNGIGYFIHLVPNFISRLSINQQLFIYIKQIFKEDDISLYGFENYEQKIWFEYLIKVDGVGAKSAVSILNIFSIKDIENAIFNKDEKFFLSISGIGNKIATRIINEMQKIPAKINLEKSFTSFIDNKETYQAVNSASTLFQEIDNKGQENIKKDKQIKENISAQDNNYQNVIQEVMQAITKLGFGGINLYRDIKFIINEIEENHKLENKNNEKYTISSEEVVSLFLKKIKK